MAAAVEGAVAERAALGELVFLIRGGTNDGRFIRTGGATCTIGGDPRCTVRIAGPGIALCEWFIRRGERRAIARGGTANGRSEPRDAVLEPGVRLTCGPCELEVVATNAASHEFVGPLAVSDAGEGSRATAAIRRPMQLSEASGRPLEERLKATHRRIKRLERQRAAVERRQARWATQLAAVTKRCGALDDLLAQREAFQREHAAWESERVRTEARFLEQLARVEELHREAVEHRSLASLAGPAAAVALERVAATADQTPCAIEPDRDEREQTQARQETANRKARAELDDERAELSRQRELWEAALADAKSELAVERGLLAEERLRWQHEFAQREESLNQQTQDLERRSRELESPSTVESFPEPHSPAHVSAVPEQSVEEYVSQLLNRLRADSPGPASQASTPPASAKSEAPGADSTAEPRVRGPAPELSNDLSAMRRLANASAQSAIDGYAHRRARRSSVNWFTTAISFLLVPTGVLAWNIWGFAIESFKPFLDAAAIVGLTGAFITGTLGVLKFFRQSPSLLDGEGADDLAAEAVVLDEAAAVDDPREPIPQDAPSDPPSSEPEEVEDDLAKLLPPDEELAESADPSSS